MSKADGSIRISANLDADPAEKKLIALKKKIKDLEETINSQDAVKSPLVKQADELAKSIAEAKKQADAYGAAWRCGVTGADKDQMDALAKAGTLQAEYDKIVSQIEKIDSKLAPAQRKLESMETDAGQLEQKIRASAGNSGAMGNAIKRAATYAKSITAHIAKGIVGGLKRAATGALSLAKRLKDAYSNSKKLGSGISNMTKKLGKVVLGVLSIRGAFTLLSRAANAYMQEDKELSGTMSNTWAALGAFLAPVIERVVSLVKLGVTYLNAFVKSLAGVDVIAKRNAKALQAQADATQSLSAAGFDDLNKLSSGDSSGVSTDDQTAFDVESIQLPHWLDEIAASFKSHDWYGLGASVAQGLNSGLESVDWNAAQQKILTVIQGVTSGINGFLQETDWQLLGNSVGAGLNTIALAVVGFFNKIDFQSLGSNLAVGMKNAIASIDWGQLGIALTDGVRAAILFLYAFLREFDFKEFGISLAEGFMGAWNNIPWEEAGDGLARGITGLLDTIGTLLVNTDWVQIAKDITAFVCNFADAVSEWLQNVNWQRFGQTVINAVADVLVNTDWGQIVHSISEFAGSFLGAFCGAVAGGYEALGDLVLDMLNSIKGYFQDYIEKAKEAGGDVILGIFDGIIDALKNFGVWIYDHIFKPFIDGFKSAFGIHSPSKVMAEMGSYIMQGLLNGIDSMVNDVVSAFSGLLKKIKGVFSNISDWFRDKFSAAWQAVKDVFSNGGEIFGGIKDGILTALKAVVNALIDGINKVISIPFDGINVALKKIKDVSILGISPFSWINTISVPQIPRLAAGAVIPPNREFLAVLGDQRSGTNIEAPADLIRQIVAEELDKRQNSRNEEQPTWIVEGSMSALARDLRVYMQKADRRVSVRLVEGGI